MPMPKLGPRLAATTPAVVKFGAKWVDKGFKLEKEWRRTQDYAPVGTLLVSGALVITAPSERSMRYEYGLPVLDGSTAVFADQLLTKFFQMIDPPGNPGNPGHGNPAGAPKQLGPGQPAYNLQGQPARVGSVMEI